MGIYVNNQKIYVVKGASLNTSIALAAGKQHTVVEEWDKCGGATTETVNLTVSAPNATTVAIGANPTSIAPGGSSTLTVSATNATAVSVSGTDGSSYTFSTGGGTQSVSPAATTTYTASAVGSSGTVTAKATVTVKSSPAATVTIGANPTSVSTGGTSTLSVTATNATGVVVTGSDGSTYTLTPTGGTQTVTPANTTTYTAEATGAGGNASAETTVTVVSSSTLSNIQHVIFMLQENHSFDNYFGMLNPYRETNGFNIGDDGNTYNVDGIDDKLTKISNESDSGTEFSLFKFTSTCIDDDSSAWLASYGDVNRYDFLTTRPIKMDGFVHTAEGYATECAEPGSGCSGQFTDTEGQRAMGYYDEGFLNYYYYMASQFALSDRWFSPVASKSIDNRIATFTGGTTQGLVQDPGSNDKLPQLAIETIFNELDKAKVSWKVYYTVTEGFCQSEDECQGESAYDKFPATDFGSLTYSFNYLRENPTGTCPSGLQPSSVVGDASNSFCVNPNHIAPLSQYFTDLTNGTLPSFAFIEAGYANNDEHPGSGQSVLVGQAQVAKVINAFMSSSSYANSVFFFAYDEGGGPYDHVPPVPGHSNDFTDASLGTIPDVGSISVQPDSYFPCLGPDDTKTTHCDLDPSYPGAHSGDAATVYGFGAQIGFRVPNFIVSPFARRHYVSHIPMDHTAIIKFVENRFIGPSTHLTARDAAQPSLLNLFDFTNVPWATPPTPPAPVTAATLGYNPCTPTNLGP
jgi:phospholipase C